jgi:hypothetical protein
VSFALFVVPPPPPQQLSPSIIPQNHPTPPQLSSDFSLQKSKIVNHQSTPPTPHAPALQKPIRKIREIRDSLSSTSPALRANSRLIRENSCSKNSSNTNCHEDPRIHTNGIPRLQCPSPSPQQLRVPPRPPRLRGSSPPPPHALVAPSPPPRLCGYSSLASQSPQENPTHNFQINFKTNLQIPNRKPQRW